MTDRLEPDCTRRLTDCKRSSRYPGVVPDFMSGRGGTTGPMNMTPQRADQPTLPWRASPSMAPGSPDRADELRLIQAMISLLSTASPSSDAEALKVLRHTFPDSPLATRIIAFAARIKQDTDRQPATYKPR
jgi:hypothetical protein